MKEAHDIDYCVLLFILQEIEREREHICVQNKV